MALTLEAVVLIDKEVISPGTVWYKDLKTGEPRKSVVTLDHIKHWHDRGNEMLAAGLTVPIPFEHDFQAHPMTPAEKLQHNAGWVKEYKLQGEKLYSVLDIQDEEIAKKLPTTVRWTSPWFSTFVDGSGRKWDNVIAHLALTTRPRVSQQAPFPSIAAALTAARECPLGTGAEEGYSFSRSGLLSGDRPLFPVAFSLYSGVALSEDDMENDTQEGKKNKFADSPDDMKLDKLLCDLLSILGVPMPENVSGSEFKRALYIAAMQKIKELSNKPPVVMPPPAPAPGAGGKKQPTQEQHPMYMTLEDINKIEDETMRNIALSMYNENVKLEAKLDVATKQTAALRDARLAEETAKRKQRADKLGRLSPKVKVDLEAMLALPSMALSMGDDGVLVDPLSQTLAVLEKGLSDIPAMLSTELSTVAQPHPTDESEQLTQEAADALSDSMARMMGCAPEKKAG